MWTSERDKHNQEEKSGDKEPDSESSRTRKQMIKQGIMDIYKDVLLFEEEIKNGKRANEEKEALEKRQKKYVMLLSVHTTTQFLVYHTNSKTCFCY